MGVTVRVGVSVRVAVGLGVKVAVGKGVSVAVAEGTEVCVGIGVEDGALVVGASEAVAQPLINPASKINSTPDRISQRIVFMFGFIMVF